jgi:hypothetical protein
MASSAPIPPLRKLLEDRLTELSSDMERLFADARDRARREIADQLNQAVRRIRLADDREELAATVVDAATAFSGGAALFLIRNRAAHGDRIRGVSEQEADAFRKLEVPLASAAALALAVETRDPVIAAATSSEVSPEMAKLAGHDGDGRAAIYPLVAGDSVPALLYTWGTVQGAALELLAQVAASVWTSLEPEPAPAPPLVTIAPVAVPAPPAAPDASAWDRLTPDEQQLHLRAQRFARVQVAEMRLFDSEAVQSGRSSGDLYGALRKRIDTARAAFHEKFFVVSPSMVDYLHLELLRTLANEDPSVLGKDYPGPL